ncbi:pre-mRNA-processing factor 39 isoform X2 [Contarinia nasturtii]|nr:pre-mRNA-processing factor 39 isoform X2 [Contarinia nasturtii]
MMQVCMDALQNKTSGVDDDATDVNNPPISIESNNENDPANQQNATTTTEATELNSDSSSLPAIAEDLPNGNSQDTKISNELDAEMVSEDELPAPAQPKIDDAEDLSDEELPGPKRAELPADTEVVSEEEFPSSNKIKRKIDGGKEGENADDNADTPKKRAKAEVDSKEPEKSNEASDKTTQKKTLPDLDRYWKAVNDDPSDFTAWTYLLQYVEQENDIEAAREAYDAFLAHYPYCYGYWRKYADYEKRKGNKKKCEDVFERGLKAIPLSVDLWIHYLTHVKQNYTDNELFVRSQFERAVTACGLEFRSDKLWEAYIKWETENKRLNNVINVYDRLLATPTQGYSSHFENFQEIVSNNAIASLIPVDEFKRLRKEVRDAETKESADDSALAPGADEPDDYVRNESEASAIKDKLLTSYRKVHKNTVAAVTTRWSFEEGIKRPYFHVKPLERCQLKNWKDYLDFEIEQGDRKRVLVLFERCLIACALYDEFWLKMIHYLESQTNEPDIVQKTREVYERACTIHHPDKPSLHLLWSACEEQLGNLNKAAEILSNLDKTCPNLMQVAYRRINLERRRGDFDKCSQLYEHYITNTKNKTTAASFAIKYARFCNKIKGDIDGAMVILQTALEKDPSNARIVLQMIDLALQRQTVNEKEIVKIMDEFLARENLDIDQKVLFTQRKVEFLEDFGQSSAELQDAQRSLQTALSKANEAKNKTSESPQKKTPKDSTQQSACTTSATYNSSYYNSGNNSAYYGNNQQYAGAQAYGDYSNYYNNYSNYSQWSYGW